MTEQYPWSDSGKQLLKELQIRIDIYGGREKLAAEIEKEELTIKPAFYTFKDWQPKGAFTKQEENYIIRNYKRMTMREIGDVLHRTKGSIEKKVVLLQKKGELKFKRN